MDVIVRPEQPGDEEALDLVNFRAFLDHHPSGWLARNVLDLAWSTAAVERGDPAMACALQEGALDPLLNALDAGTRPPGFVNWPLPFLLIP
jgi:hypothetical protein